MATVKKILVASDGSEHSNRAATYAGNLARELSATVEILAVHSNEILNIQLVGTGAWPGGVPVSSVSIDEVRANIEANTQADIFDPTTAALGNLETPVNVHQHWGNAGEIICEQAELLGCDLIVMGSRGRSTFAKLLLGSVTMQVLNHATCPVMVVK